MCRVPDANPCLVWSVLPRTHPHYKGLLVPYWARSVPLYLANGKHYVSPVVRHCKPLARSANLVSTCTPHSPIMPHHIALCYLSFVMCTIRCSFEARKRAYSLPHPVTPDFALSLLLIPPQKNYCMHSLTMAYRGGDLDAADMTQETKPRE